MTCMMHRCLVVLQLLVTHGDLVAGFGSLPRHLPPPPASSVTPPPPPPASSVMPPPPPDSSASASPEYVENHNAWRALHEGTDNLVYDADLAADAQAFAESCPTGHNDPNQGDNGENLYWAGSTVAPDTPYSAAVNTWYDEIKDYAWPQTFGGQTSNGGVVGHFTQVVWKETTKIGCGKHTGCTNMFEGYINSAVVCRCAPPARRAGLLLPVPPHYTLGKWADCGDACCCADYPRGNFMMDLSGIGQPSSGYYNQVGACKNGMVDDASKHCKPN